MMRLHFTIALSFALLALSTTGCVSDLGRLPVIESAKSRIGTMTSRRNYRSGKRQYEIEKRNDRLAEQYKTVPEVEANLDMRLRQRFEMGEPELDVEKAREVLASAITDHNSLVTQYESELAQWEVDRDFFVANNPNGTFSTPRPKRPELAVMAQDIPMKISLRMGTKIDNANVTGFRTRQIPAND